MFPREWGLFKWNYSGGRLHLAGLQERNVFFFFFKECRFDRRGHGSSPWGLCAGLFYPRSSIWGVEDLL